MNFLPVSEKSEVKKAARIEVEVASLKQRPRRKLSSKSAVAFKPGFAPLFGLAVAVGWHYLHQAGDLYQPSPDDPRFWFHLLVEGTIALYAALFYLIIWKLWQKFK
jgi:hypothetical protein